MTMSEPTIAVTAQIARDSARMFRLDASVSHSEATLAIEALYIQIMDLSTGEIPAHFRRLDLEGQVQNGAITTREFVATLATSTAYIDRFYTPYPNTKAIEFLFRHLLGRAPLNQAEIADYNRVMAEQGFVAAVNMMVNSVEYTRYFGGDVVPYHRSPSLGAGK
jgi:phycobilisome core-membrane linker protein